MASFSLKPKPVPPPEKLPPAVREARLFLQREGYPVYRAHVIGGPKDRWVVGSYNHHFTDAEMVELADGVRQRRAA